jgi:hypothetical protein
MMPSMVTAAPPRLILAALEFLLKRKDETVKVGGRRFYFRDDLDSFIRGAPCPA